jgi:acyl carrier protein
METCVDSLLLDKVSKRVQESVGLNRMILVDEDLRSLGLDSMKSVTLIIDLEECFDIVFEDDELLFENFSTIQKIANRVSGKLGEY